MKHTKIIFSLALVFYLISGCVKVDDIELARQNAEEMHEMLIHSIQKKDASKIAKLYLNKTTPVLALPGRSEIFTGRDSIQNAWEDVLKTVENVEFFRGKTALTIGQDLKTAWIISYDNVNVKVNGQQKNYPVITSLVLEKRGPAWFFVQSHFSINESVSEADANLDAKQAQVSIPEKVIKDSISNALPDSMVLEKDSVAVKDTTQTDPNEKDY